MSAKEGAFRIRNALQARLERLGSFTVRHPLPVPRAGASWVRVPGGLAADDYAREARAVASGVLSVFALEDVDLGSPPDWNRDPLTGTVAPLTYGKTLDYRDETIVGNIKYLWEPNRHLLLVRLAQAYALTRDRAYLDSLRWLLESWMEQCPCFRGPNWTSSLELGLRLINWSILWQLAGGWGSSLFDGDAGRAFRTQWLDFIYQHVHFIDRNYSRFSSANNHLLGELTGVFVASLTWPYWPRFETWGNRARRTLEDEAAKQNHADGVNKEQAIWYHQFVFDFLLISGLAARASGRDFSSGYWGRLEKMIEYAASIMDVSGNPPMIGDADDGLVVNLSAEENFSPFRSMIATGAVLFHRGDFLAKAGRLDHKTLWLLGDAAREAFEHIAPAPGGLPVRREFSSGGYYVLGSDFETEREIRMVVDCGPLGYLSLAAHGHADALALTLSVSGRQVLVDSGTYAYHTRQKWRSYFRGTSAHNTLRLDGMDQSVIGGNFLWLRRARATLEAFEPQGSEQWFVGNHDGYLRLKDPVTHQREVRFYRQEARFRVTDRIACKGRHEAERFWHFSEDCDVLLEDGLVRVCCGPILLALRDESPDVGMEVLRGDETMPLGWISRRFDIKEPTSTVIMRNQVCGDSEFVTEFVIKWDETCERKG